MDSAEDDDVGIGIGRFLTKSERVTHEVGHILDLLDLVIVREDDGVPFLLEVHDLGDQIGGMGGSHRNEGDEIWNSGKREGGIGLMFSTNSLDRQGHG